MDGLHLKIHNLITNLHFGPYHQWLYFEELWKSSINYIEDQVFEKKERKKVRKKEEERGK